MIDDESKKFIKETIENAVENKLSEHEKKTESSKRLNELKYEKKEIEDRKKLIAELSERERKGQATIAERFEKLKLSVDTAIPKDFKDAWKTGTQGIQAGANQVGRGVGHLTARAMMSNPLTAFLYQNRDIAGAVGDIGVGTIKAGWGALKGIGHGALGIANSVKNLFGKNEEEETEEELNLPKPKFLGGESQTEKLVSEKSGWQKQIQEMHKIMTKDLIKEQKSSNTVLSKGLKGLDEGMKAVKGFTDMIAAKQKLILGGIMLGAAAIIGLVAWFKSGGLMKALGAKEGTRDTNLSDTSNLADTQFKKLKEDRQNDINTAINKEGQTGNIEEVKKTISAKDSNGKNIGIPTFLNSGYKMKATAGQPYRAPFDLKVINWDMNKRNPNGIDMEVERISTLTKKNAVIMNVENPIRVPGQTAKKGEIIGQVPAIGEIFIKDIDKKEFEEYKKIIDKKATRTEKEKQQEIKNMQNYMDAGQSNKIRNTFDALTKSQMAKDNDVFEDGKVTKGDAQKQTKEAAEAKQRVAAELDEDVKQGMSIGQGHKNTIGDNVRTTFKKLTDKSSNWDRAKQQEEELKKKKKDGNVTGGAAPIENGYMGQLPSLTVKQTDKTDPYRSADNVTIGELNLMNPNTPVNIAMVNN
jgi:hypothetical protein